MITITVNQPITQTISESLWINHATNLPHNHSINHSINMWISHLANYSIIQQLVEVILQILSKWDCSRLILVKELTKVMPIKKTHVTSSVSSQKGLTSLGFVAVRSTWREVSPIKISERIWKNSGLIDHTPVEPKTSDWLIMLRQTYLDWHLFSFHGHQQVGLWFQRLSLTSTLLATD